MSKPTCRICKSPGVEAVLSLGITPLADGLRRLVSPEAATVSKRGGTLLSEEFSWDQVARTWLSQVEAIV